MAQDSNRPHVGDLLDRWLYRYPFEGRSARRYAERERCGFGDLDARLIAHMAPDLDGAGVFLDVGAGPGWLARQLPERYPSLAVLTLEPSRDLARTGPGIHAMRGLGEALPLADDSVDVALCLSSIRHVRDRHAALSELRRVVRPRGALHVIELDPAASRTRIRNHARAMRSLSSRISFGPLVVRTAPTAGAIAELALRSGWQRALLERDHEQPVYLLRLS
jgi:ubiquinone/menaquinone biosynthesis C-methylase UbiE